MVKKFNIVSSISLAIIFLSTLSSYAGSFTVTQLTNNGLGNMNPQVSGNNAAWRGGNEIYFYDGSTTTQITNDGSWKSGLQMSGNNIVWKASSDPMSSKEIYLYNGSTTTQITNDGSWKSGVNISGNNVVWTGNNEIYFYNGSTTAQITSDGNSKSEPVISGNNIVWSGDGMFGEQIYFYNGSSKIMVTLDDQNKIGLQIDGNNFIWQGYNNNGSWIYLCNGSSITEISHNSWNYAQYPQISGNKVVWYVDDSTGDREIFFFDGTTVIQLTDNSIEDLDPVIDGDYIAWIADNKVFFYDGSAITQVFDNNGRILRNLQISGNNLVWSADDGSDEQIYLAQYSGGAGAVPEPATLILFGSSLIVAISRSRKQR